jgi:membrane peptidoglycan carboxypeptidase
MKKKSIKKIIKRIAIFLLLCILAAAVYLGVKILKIRNEAIAMVDEAGSEVFKQNLTTIVYDADGNTIASLSSEKDAYYLESDDIPYIVKQIFIVTEDRKFYDHSGVDYKSVLRAVIELIKNEGEITQGGSTITQQLARNIYLSHEVTLNRKLTEVFIAKELEKRYTKDEILEYYINNIYFANGLYGVEAAAKGYFGKSACELSLSELCYICAIPNNPEMYNPLENSENTISRRNRILKQLKDYGIIDMEEYEEALSQSVVLSPSEKVKNNYVETFVRYSATRELMEKQGFKFRYEFESDEEKEEYLSEYNKKYGECNSLLFTGGYRIYTSIDMEKQELLQETVDNILMEDTTLQDNGVYSLQGSAVSIDNSTGYVVAVVGGRTQDQDGYTLNRAYQSFRQPGSAIKPILIYTPLFERGYTPDSIVVDEKISGGPVNSPNTYAGEITVRTALALSKNTIAWKMFDKIGCNTTIRYLLNMQFSHIVKADYVPAMSIGGMTYGVSSLEMAAAYATLANEGVYRTPTCIVKITDAFGNVILDNGEDRQDGEVIYEKNAVLMTTDILKDVLNWGTGKNYNIDNAICAAKTGTTNDNKDCWLVGYSKYYTTAVWCGYDMPKTLEGDTVKSAGKIWQSYMEKIHQDKPELEFTAYEKYGTEKNEIETTEKQQTSEETIDEEATTEEVTTDETSSEGTTENITASSEEPTAQTNEAQSGEEQNTVYTETEPNENSDFDNGYTPYIPQPDDGDGLYIQEE